MIRLSENSALTAEEKLLLARCREIIREVDPSADVILYGSRARGDADPEADYDVLVLIDGNADLEKENLISRKIYPLELESGRVLTVLLYSRRQWDTPLYRAMPFHANVEREGIIV